MSLCGWKPDRVGTERFVQSLPHPHVGGIRKLMAQREQRDAKLWEVLRKVAPDWRRGSQGIGDCVSWGAEFACTLLLAQLAAEGRAEFCEAATEPIYGGCRVEVHGGRPPMGPREEGAAGSWAADWLNKFGVLVRKDYSRETGNPDHDLRKYSPQRARDWQGSGCGGRNDKDALDNVARNYPVKDVSQVRTIAEAEAALQAGCPITIASDVGFEGNRDSEGIIRRRGQWPHQMCLAGVMYLRGEPLFRCVNSWGKSASGPDPHCDWPAMSDCSWWIVAEDLERILRQEDSFALSKVEGFALPPFDPSQYDWA